MGSLETVVSYADLAAKHGINGANAILKEQFEKVEVEVKELQAQIKELKADNNKFREEYKRWSADRKM